MSVCSRRQFLVAAGAALAAPRISRTAQGNVPTLLDHILLGCSNLEDGIAYVEEHLGVRAAFGGVHPGVGTQNALLSLGERRYLEIIAPDPNQPKADDARSLKKLKDPKIIGWAAHRGHLDEFALTLKKAGIEAVGPTPGSRKRPDGKILKWKTLVLKDDANGLLPFFIDWGERTMHPSVDAPHGCKLRAFQAATPDFAALKLKVDQMKLDLFVLASDKPNLSAEIEGPDGHTFELLTYST